MASQSFFSLPLYEDDAQSMLDKHNIDQLVRYERYCRDNLRFDDQRDCYAPSSRVRITWYDGDGREFVERSRAMARSDASRDADGTYRSLHHKVYGTFVWLNGARAVAEMQCMMGAIERVDGHEYDHSAQSRLLFGVERTGGRWAIRSMDCIYERDSLTPLVPDAAAAVDPREFERFRPSYKCISWYFDRIGMPCNQGLPGDDRPQTVSDLYDETSAWLFA